ncbi:CHASE3 domain-containing protein [Segnochrobactrum spirostomi]|uniref:histidine kinase n=1 Tax=Segnochrobactrum spirostomi TaxID=2608987 RepID=A0A6A7XZX3_9HYPH|nr:CHASE3 domain-containing protein [Segnochrobactrum spirostomi]MQT11677.1 response regulator [Segnochrobactrum spirostomi]
MPLSGRPTGSRFPRIAALILLLLLVGSGLWLSVEQRTTVHWVRHTIEVQNHLSELKVLLLDAESARRGFIIRRDPDEESRYRSAAARIPTGLDELEKLTADNPRQRATLATLKPAIATSLGNAEKIVGLIKSDQRGAAGEVFSSPANQDTLQEIAASLAAMRAEEDQLLAERAVRADRLVTILQIGMVLVGLLICALAYVYIRDVRERMIALQKANLDLVTEARERAAAEAQVRQLQRLETLGQLTGGIAHDFNNMLAIVIGFLGIAKRRIAGNALSAADQAIDNAMDGARRAATLTARLLAYSRRQPLEPKVLDVNRLVGGMSDLLRRAISEPVSIEIVQGGGLWRTFADPAQLENALLNLAVNARDAMPGGGRLTIETANAFLDEAYARAHDEVAAGQYVMVSVTDTGTGIPPDIIDKVFEPFFTTKGVGEGTGLGLSQVFGFVKQSSGHVKVYSEVGHGTSVKIYLPRHTSEEADLWGGTPADSTVPAKGSGQRILVAEDEPAVLASTSEALRELGYTVIAAGGAREALRRLEVEPDIDLLMTDVVMPEMNGRQLAEAALALKPSLKVLYTTGYTRNAVVHNGVLDRGTALLQKPFTLEELARKVDETLR